MHKSHLKLLIIAMYKPLLYEYLKWVKGEYYGKPNEKFDICSKLKINSKRKLFIGTQFIII